MAQRVQVLVVCDLHGDETPGEETISFSLDGSAYEIDVCGSHAAELRDAFAPYVGAARRAGGRVAGRRRGAGRTSRQDVADIRAWAKSQGLKVSERGRISRDILEKYEAARG